MYARLITAVPLFAVDAVTPTILNMAHCSWTFSKGDFLYQPLRYKNSGFVNSVRLICYVAPARAILFLMGSESVSVWCLY